MRKGSLFCMILHTICELRADIFLQCSFEVSLKMPLGIRWWDNFLPILVLQMSAFSCYILHLHVCGVHNYCMTLLSSLQGSSVPPGSLRKGDIYTHAYHGFSSTIIDTQKRPPVIDSAVLEAKRRGVCFDIGHGQGSLNGRWLKFVLSKDSGLIASVLTSVRVTFTALHTTFQQL